MSWNSKESIFSKQTNLSFNYISRKKLSITAKHICQQFTPSVTMYATNYNPERFMIVPKQDDEVLYPECRLMLEGWLRTYGISLIDTEPLSFFFCFFHLCEFFNYKIRMPTQEDKSVNTATFDYRLFFIQDVFPCSKVNLANENIVLTCYGCPLSLPKMTSCLLKSCH